MTPDRWSETCAAFEAALEVETERREDFVRERYPSLAEAVLGMLRDDAAASLEGFLVPPLPTEPFRVTGSRVGQRFGPYLIEERIGAGGMGEVYRAARVEGYRASVALKVVKAGADIERFLRERQLLADLAHPGIAALLDGGTTPDGAPYFVMELVPGVPLDRHCERLGIAERLRLLRQACLAVHHAHARGVLHRDLKPANILATPEGVVKVVDFGIARRLDEETIAGGLACTPGYAAPEQAGGGTLSAATDVHALGATLYALLAGRPPFRGESLEETLRQAREDEPVPPSRFQPGIPRDAETICLKALAKEPARRYASAQEMADDLGRYLEGKPIRARRVGIVERVWKWSRRNPATAALIVMVFLTFIGIVWAVRREYVLDREQRAERLVERIRGADFAALPALLDELPSHPEARSLLEGAEDVRSRLALLAWDDSQAKALHPRMLEAGPDEFLVLRERLSPDARLWETLADEDAPEDRRFRAACALARQAAADERWAKHGKDVARWLAGQPPHEIERWATACRPIRDAILEPLAALRSDGAALAMSFLIDPSSAGEMIARADREALLSPFVSLLRRTPALREGLERELAASLKEPATDDRARREARVGIALLRTGDSAAAWTLLDGSPQRRARFIAEAAPLGLRSRLLIERLIGDSPGRAGLLLALGEFKEGAIGAKDRAALLPRILAMYRDDPDAGVHGAAFRLLRLWGRESDARMIDAARVGPPRGDRRWFVNSQRRTFSVIPAQVYMMGAGRERHPRRLPRTFALAALETTLADFDRFLKDAPPIFRRQFVGPETKQEPTAPVVGTRWLEAVAYCRWLSEKEGIPEAEMCYPPLRDIEAAMAGKKALALPPDYLSRIGYRLPTEAEWECACRAGTTTARPWGNTDSLLARYAWADAKFNAPPPPTGLLLPNGHGLFDMLGNAAEWCHGEAVALPGGSAIVLDAPEAKIEARSMNRVLRGGAWLMPPESIHTAYRAGPSGAESHAAAGFRVARTMPPDRGSLSGFAYIPAEGDLVFFDDKNPAWRALFAYAGTGPPLHMGIVVKRLGGGFSLLEAGPDDTVSVTLQDVGKRLEQFARDNPRGLIQIRRCKKALAPKESRALSLFAAQQDGKRYAVLRLLAQGTPLSARNLLRPLAKTHLDRDAWFCSELAVAAATVAGLVGKEVPANTAYPRDLVDESRFELAATWHPAEEWSASR